MGVTSADLERGLIDFGRVVVQGMQTWDSLRKTTAAPPAATEPVAKTAVVNQQSVYSDKPAAATGLAALPPIVWLAGAGLAVWWLARRKR